MKSKNSLRYSKLVVGVLAFLFLNVSCTAKPVLPTTTPSLSPTPMPYGIILANNVPVRSGPGDGFDVVGTLNQGDTITVLGVKNNWYKIESPQTTGDVWVYADFVHGTIEPAVTLSLLVTPSPTTTAVAPQPTPTLEKGQEPTVALSSPVTPSPTVTSVAPEPTPVPCNSAPDGWIIYIVQSGDTLFSLSRETGITIEALKEVNCLVSDGIYVGQRLHLPNIPPTSVATLPSPPTQEPTLLPPTPSPLPMPEPTSTAVPSPTNTPSPPPVTVKPTLPVSPTPTPTDIPPL